MPLKLLSILITLIFMGGCSFFPSTPLVMAEVGNHEFQKYKQEIRLRAAAALKEEPDLITYSVKGIAERKTDEVINTYLKGYGKDDYSQDMKSIAIYQIGLIYMNRLNENRDDDKAKLYFQRHLIEFPYSILQNRIREHIATIEERKKQPVQLTPEQIISRMDKSELLNEPAVAFDHDLTPMSKRAILEGRLDDAHGVYMTVYNNPGSSDKIRAKSLYQLGLIYMSPNNKKQNIQKATAIFRKLLEEFPDTEEFSKAESRLTQIANGSYLDLKKSKS